MYKCIYIYIYIYNKYTNNPNVLPKNRTQSRKKTSCQDKPRTSFSITAARTILSNPLKVAAVQGRRCRLENCEVVCWRDFLQDFALCPPLIFPRKENF